MTDLLANATGAVIYAVLRVVDLAQTALKVQAPKRPLTERERDVLRPIFGGSLPYDRVEIVDGAAGLLGVSRRAMTMRHTIYLPRPSEQTLVHECVHVWQFETSGFRYITNSVLHQLAGLTIRRGYQPYDWRPRIAAGESWHQLRSVEAQAQFVEDVYAHGERITPPVDTSPGAFFRGDGAGGNRFVDRGTDRTAPADAAWARLRAG